MDERPIGVFDSGVGGLTVVRSLIDLLPRENLIYFGDTGRGPYGGRSLEEVRCFSIQIVQWLVDQGVKLVVIACNTASAAALQEARARFRVPIIGVVEPGVRAALKTSRQGRVGMIGTAGTVASGAYEDAMRAMRGREGKGDLISVACPRFVEFVEKGEVWGAEISRLASMYLMPLREACVDTLILGCTHYPLLARVISDAVGRHVTLLSSADETAFEVTDILVRTGKDRRGLGLGWHRFVCTSDTERFRLLGVQFLGPEVREVAFVGF